MKLRDLLELCRVSNLPTVWSNSVLGFFAGAELFHVAQSGTLFGLGNGLVHAIADDPHIYFELLFLLTVPFSLLYCSGMALNDYVDRRVDLLERPQRPIPSGRVNPITALGIALGFMQFGIAGVWLLEQRFYFDILSWRATALAGLLALVIVFYNVIHQASLLSVFLMGLCRGLVVVTAAAVHQPPSLAWQWWVFVAAPAFVLIMYTVLISVVARREVDHAAEPRRFGGPKTVMNMIAAMPLLDAAWLVSMGLWPASLFCVGCAGLTKLGHRKVAGS